MDWRFGQQKIWRKKVLPLVFDKVGTDKKSANPVWSNYSAGSEWAQPFELYWDTATAVELMIVAMGKGDAFYQSAVQSLARGAIRRARATEMMVAETSALMAVLMDESEGPSFFLFW